MEVPPSTLKLGRMVLPVGGGAYLRFYPLALTRWALRRLNEFERMPAVLYTHPWEVDPDQPRIRASLSNRLRHYTRLGRTYDRLLSLLSRFRFGPMRDVVARQETIVEKQVA